jgi:hypothetical protein
MTVHRVAPVIRRHGVFRNRVLYSIGALGTAPAAEVVRLERSGYISRDLTALVARVAASAQPTFRNEGGRTS